MKCGGKRQTIKIYVKVPRNSRKKKKKNTKNHRLNKSIREQNEMENDLYSLCSYIIHFIAFYISFFAIRCLDIYVFEPILSCECGGCYSLAYCRFDPKQYRCVQTPLFVSIGSCFSSNTMIANPTTPRSTQTHTPHFCSSFRWLWLHNFIASRPLWLQLLLLFISYLFFIVFARLTLCLHSFNVMWLFSHRVRCQSQSATCFARQNIIVLYVKWCNFMLNDNFVMWAELDMARLVVHLMSNYYQCKVLGYLFHSSSSIGMYANECLVVIVAFIAARGEKWFLRKLFNRETI